MLDSRWGRTGAVVLAALFAGPATADEAAQKEARAQAILAREEGRGRPFDPAYRARMKARLAAGPIEDLDAVEKRGQGLVPGGSPVGFAIDVASMYEPVPPCRIVDTRLAGGVLPAGGQRNFYVAGGVGFGEQGGNPGGCGVPFGLATAAVVNFVAARASGPGNVRAWPYGGVTPNASIINYAQISGLNLANAVVVPLCAPEEIDCSPGDITVQADVSAVNVVADVLGYFFEVAHPRVAYRVNGGGGVLASTCTNPGGTIAEITVPADGTVVVRGSATLRLFPRQGSATEVWTAIGTTPTECPNAELGARMIMTRIPAAHPTVAANDPLFVQVQPTRNFTVGPGVHRFYLNTIQLGPPETVGVNNVFTASLDALFIPSTREVQ